MESHRVLRETGVLSDRLQEGIRGRRNGPAKKPRGVKVQTEEAGTSLGSGGRGRDKSWKFAPSKGRVHKTCSDSI